MDSLLGQFLAAHGVSLVVLTIVLAMLNQLRAAGYRALMAQTSRIQNEDWRNLAVRFVRDAEQAVDLVTNGQKKAAVTEKLLGEGVAETAVDALVEAAVHEVKAPLKAIAAPVAVATTTEATAG